MFAKVVVIFALAFVAAAYQQGLEVPGVYEKTQYGVYHPLQGLIKSVVGYPYYKYPYYGYGNIEGEQGYVTPVDVGYNYPYYQYTSYYPQYINSWLQYPYYAKYYGQTIPYTYGSYPSFWSKITGDYYGYGGKYYTGVPY